MGTEFLNDDSRIELWQRTVQLFKNCDTYTGPFYSVGITSYEIEHVFSKDKDGFKPDIFGWSPRGTPETGDDQTIALELTVDKTANKNGQLLRYSQIPPENLRVFGAKTDKSPISILVSLSELRGHDSHCQLDLGGKNLVCYNLDSILDERIHDALKAANGTFDIEKLSSSDFTIVPESKHGELKRGMVQAIMEMFSPDANSFTARDITIICLGELHKHMDIKALNDLKSKVETELDGLITKHLKGEIVKKKDVYTINKSGEAQSRRKSISSKLNNWINDPQRNFG